MRKYIWLAMTAACLIGADDAAKEYERFEGTWKFASLEMNGMKLPLDALKKASLTLKGDQFTYDEGSGVSKGTFKIDPGKNPKTIDITFTEGPSKGDALLGIYELEGDVYKVCLGMKGAKRPTEFSATKDSQQVLEILHREKK
jgi:uncharacterized protein (TIGR03067 family)